MSFPAPPSFLYFPSKKSLLGDEKSGKLESSKDEVEQYIRETHSNPFLGYPLGDWETVYTTS